MSPVTTSVTGAVAQRCLPSQTACCHVLVAPLARLTRLTQSLALFL
eukprot:CAMPEP_0203927012 /NCGR_PEP_ID=MMETSP0359-20131031/66485_1 /ASSEMBLY_ACC=CAM_ASM_000338 /TAXON_ID=268821 /ORGANISM="Scrippsiella Hangoei, Strain SHTV-5" /LENGTH=45 /DNA_ID= /DNA_START= /DNA_END= /DNA_ORIENTATION=